MTDQEIQEFEPKWVQIGMPKVPFELEKLENDQNITPGPVENPSGK